jgi:hypothetical protein
VTIRFKKFPGRLNSSSFKNQTINQKWFDFLSMGEMEFQQISLIIIKIKQHKKRILTI